MRTSFPTVWHDCPCIAYQPLRSICSHITNTNAIVKLPALEQRRIQIELATALICAHLRMCAASFMLHAPTSAIDNFVKRKLFPRSFEKQDLRNVR